VASTFWLFRIICVVPATAGVAADKDTVTRKLLGYKTRFNL
jgi:hypothetical protein